MQAARVVVVGGGGDLAAAKLQISDFRFQIPNPLVWDVHCRFQISDFSAARGSGMSDFSVSDFRKHKSGPIGQEISIVCHREKTRKNTGRQRETCYHHYSRESGTPGDSQ